MIYGLQLTKPADIPGRVDGFEAVFHIHHLVISP